MHIKWNSNGMSYLTDVQRSAVERDGAYEGAINNISRIEVDKDLVVWCVGLFEPDRKMLGRFEDDGAS